MNKKYGQSEKEYQKVDAIENGAIQKLDIPNSYGYGVRHIQILLGFLSLAIGFIARAHMGVTIVAMTNTLHAQLNNVTMDIHLNVSNDLIANTKAWADIDYYNESNPDINFEEESTTTETARRRKIHSSDRKNISDLGIYKKYDWPKSLQEMVLGAFFLGYFIMMIPMGAVCQKYGGKLPMQIALFVSGASCIVTPWMAAWGGWKAVCACRVILGLSQAGLYPGLQTFVAKWSPVSELGKFYSWAFAGSIFGTILAFQLAGILVTLGWPYIYWVIGSICLVMFVMLTVFGAATPSEHRSISVLERNFIMGNAKVEKKNLKVPLKAMVTSKYAWAAWIAHAGSTVAFAFMFSQVPTYIHYILNVDIKKSGLISSLPYIASFIAGMIFGPVSDYITNNNILSLKNARRVSNSIAEMGMGACLLAVSCTKSVELAIMCFVLLMIFQAALHTGWMVNYIDLTPRFSASMMCFGNTISQAIVLGVPVLVAYIVTDVTNQFQWRIIFFVMAGFTIVSNIVFVTCMSAEKQPWNDEYDGYEETETEEQEKVMKSYSFEK